MQINSMVYVISIPDEPVPALVFVYVQIKCLRVKCGDGRGLTWECFPLRGVQEGGPQRNRSGKTEGSDRSLLALITVSSVIATAVKNIIT